MSKGKKSQDRFNAAIRVVAKHKPNAMTTPELAQAFADLQAEIGDKTNAL
jgi:hypothetical protein